jgi:hypothetical protein
MMRHGLKRLIGWMTPAHRKKWARAMQARRSANDGRAGLSETAQENPPLRSNPASFAI